MAKEILITQEGLEDLKNELEYLKVEKRTEIAEKIKIARSFGDLSENSEYDEAKKKQNHAQKLLISVQELKCLMLNLEKKLNTKS